MPLHYGSALAEHKAVRTEAGLFDISHMRFAKVSGSDAKKAMMYLLANNVAKLTERGSALYSCMLSESAGVIDDVICYYHHDEEYRIVLNSSCAEKDLRWMNSTLSHYDVAISDYPTLSMIAIQGPKAVEIFCKTFDEYQQVRRLKKFTSTEINSTFIARTGYTGEDGIEIVAEPEAIINICNTITKSTAPENKVSLCGLAARDSLRLEAGLNLYGNDMDETISPIECDLGWTVALDSERCFVGKQALLEKNKKEQRHMKGIVMNKKAIPRAGNRIVEGGIITSGGYSPTLDCGIGFVLLPSQLKDHDKIQVEIRGNPVEAQVSSRKFLKQFLNNKDRQG